MRKPIIAGNWKLHKNIAETAELIRSLRPLVRDAKDVQVIVAPVFTTLAAARSALEGSAIALAAQNCSCETQGAFTGEVSPGHLIDAGCSHVILGHSERRAIYGESDALINRKVKAALAAGLDAVFCIGETLEEREQDRTLDVLRAQVTEGLAGFEPAQMRNLIIAYEPVWAIGTGRTAGTEQAQEAHSFVRGMLFSLFGKECSEAVRILYGGSVKPDNVDALMAQSDIDGALVGGASLKAEDFARIVNFVKP